MGPTSIPLENSPNLCKTSQKGKYLASLEALDGKRSWPRTFEVPHIGVACAWTRYDSFKMPQFHPEKNPLVAF